MNPESAFVSGGTRGIGKAIALRFALHDSICSLFGKCSSAPVSTTPPETPLTRIPRGASSTAR